MAVFPRRDLAHELHKHFHGSPEERFVLALRLGRETLKLFLATLPPRASAATARERLRRTKRFGRRASPVMEADRI